METDFSKLKELKYCIRTKHSKDMPLKQPRMNCAFLEGKECSIHPAHIDYLEANNLGNDWTAIKFRCVLFNKDGMSIAEQCDYDRASLSIQREERRQSLKDSKVLNSIRNRVSQMIFEEINYELQESGNWGNFRIIDNPEGDLQNSESSFKVYVDQHSVGNSGDSYAGTVCIELPNGKYLIWDFWM